MSNKEMITKVKTGKMSPLEYIKHVGEFENFKSWCNSHEVPIDDKSADFYFDQTVSDYCEEDVLMTM